MLSVLSGLTIIKTEPVISSPIDPDEVFKTLENDRKAGLLSKNMASAMVSYQASTKHPGLLEQIDPDGNITIGEFKNGQFIEISNVVS